MYKNIRANFYYFTADIRFSLMIFWSIFLATMLVLYFLSMSTDVKMIVTSPSLAIYIFCAISGFVMTKESFPFSIKLGSTRNGYLISASIFNIFLAVTMAFIGLLVSGLINLLIDIGNVTNLNLYQTVDITVLHDTWYNQFLLDILINSLLLFLGFLLGSVFYKFGLVGGVAAIALAAIVLLVPTFQEKIIDLLGSIEGGKLALNYLNIILISLFSIIPTWLFLSRASTIPGASR